MAVQDPFPPMHFSVAIVGALIGIVILLFGRKLFWLCVAAVGFAVGVEIAPHLVNEPSPLLALTVALVLGRAPGSGPGGRGFKSHQPVKITNGE